MNKKAVILISGGVDSATCLAMAAKLGFDCYALSFAYGQKQYAELEAAKKITQQFKVAEHKIFPLALNEFKGSALTDPALSVPAYTPNKQIPITYVPARNTIFLSIALAWAEVIHAYDLFVGVCAVDYSGYSDCRPEYIEAFQQMAHLATKTAIEDRPIKIHTPLLYLSKAETILAGSQLGIDYSQTVSCYNADEQGRACKQCHSCVIRRNAFTQAGITDPTRYI